MEQNKIRTYTFYAIGEILLVVIGILIALQVNNWNEEKAQTNNVLETLNELSETYSGVLSETYFIEVQDSVLTAYRQNDLSLMPSFTRGYDRNPLSYSGRTAGFYDKRIDLLLNQEQHFPDAYSSILRALKDIQFVRGSALASNVQSMEYLEEQNSTYLRNNFNWYDENSPEAIEKRRSYFLNDSIFQNYLFSYMQNFRMYKQFTYRSEANEALTWAKNAELNNLQNWEFIKNGLRDINMKPLEELGCENQSEIKTDNNSIIWILIFNNSDRRIEYSREADYREFLEAGEAIVTSYFPRNHAFSQIRDQEGCRQKYRIEPGGYIIVN